MRLTLRDDLILVSVTVVYQGREVEVPDMEVVFPRCVNYLQVGPRAVEQFEIEVGGIDDAFDINGILGMDFLLRTGAIINLGTLQLDFPYECRGKVET